MLLKEFGDSVRASVKTDIEQALKDHEDRLRLLVKEDVEASEKRIRAIISQAGPSPDAPDQAVLAALDKHYGQLAHAINSGHTGMSSGFQTVNENIDQKTDYIRRGMNVIDANLNKVRAFQNDPVSFGTFCCRACGGKSEQEVQENIST